MGGSRNALTRPLAARRRPWRASSGARCGGRAVHPRRLCGHHHPGRRRTGGIRQSTLYHHFANKDDILATLLEGTVAPTAAYAERLLTTAEPVPGARLWALVRFNAELLLGGLSNLGALYQLPEVRGERFAEFRQTRCRLAAAYRELISPLQPLPEAELRLRGELVLGLVEGAVAVARGCSEQDAAEVPAAAADAAVRLASDHGCPAEHLALLRAAALAL